MSPALADAIDAARELAWQPTHNLGPHRLAARHARHNLLVARLRDVTGLSANASPELVFLLAAIRRVAACSFANRMGHAYYERKQAVAELRGCLDVYDRSLTAPRPGPDSVADLSPGVSRRRQGRIGVPRAPAPTTALGVVSP